MSGLFADRLSLRRAPLAFVLCALAFLFAVEAKTAWYGPLNARGSDVRSAKALPEMTPKLVKHRVLTPDPLHPHAAFGAVSLLSAVSPPAAHVVSLRQILRPHRPRFTAALLSPAHFLRPPPPSGSPSIAS